MASSSSTINVVRRPRRQVARRVPESVEPMMAVLSPALPVDPKRWAFEIKWDGVRAVAMWDGASLRLQSRNLLDITRRYPELWPLGGKLDCRTAVLDGEIIAYDAAGLPSFPRLQRRMHATVSGANDPLVRQVPAVFVVFDILYLNGRWTTHHTFRKRRELLEQVMPAPSPHWHLTPSMEGAGEAMLDAVRRHGLEGVVAKRVDSIYEPGVRSPAWLKVKITRRQELVIGGWVPEKGAAHRMGALLVGYHDGAPADGRKNKEDAGGETPLRYAGKVGTGFSTKDREALARRLAAMQIAHSPFADPVPERNARFCRPELVGEFEYRRWPDGGMIQQASFKGLREDKAAAAVVKELHEAPEGSAEEISQAGSLQEVTR